MKISLEQYSGPGGTKRCEWLRRAIRWSSGSLLLALLAFAPVLVALPAFGLPATMLPATGLARGPVMAQSFADSTGGPQLNLLLNPGKRYQRIHSFGASDAWAAKFIGKWTNEEKKNRIADLLFSMDTLAGGSPEGIGLSLWRFNIGAGSFEQGAESGIRSEWRREECFLGPGGSYDWNKQKGQQWFLEAARRRGVKYTLGFTNSPPVQMTRNGKAFSPGGNALNIRADQLDDFAAFLVKVADHFSFDYISPVNEPQWDWAKDGNWAKQEGSPAQNKEISKLVKSLSKALLAARSETKVVVGEAGEWDFLYERNKDGRGNQLEAFFVPSSPLYIADLPNVLNVMSAHSYWTTCPETKLAQVRVRVAEKAASTGSAPGLWQSEFGVLGNICDRLSGPPRSTGIAYGLYVASVIHHDLALAGVTSWQWWLAINPYDYSDGLVYINDPEGRINLNGTKEDGTVLESKQLWAMGNYSRFIRPGMQRVEAILSPEPSNTGAVTAITGGGQPLVSAYIDAESKRMVIVLVNTDEEKYTLQLPEKLSAAPVAVYTTDARQNLKHSIHNGTRFSLAPKSVVTLVATY